MQEFSDLVFPSEIARKSTGGPEFFTSIAINAAGKETRNLNWQHARMKYKISMAKLNADEIQQVINFFYIHRGAAVGFRFRDWSDYQAQGEVLTPISTDAGSRIRLQLYKTYANGNYSYRRKITKPTPGTVKLYVQQEIMSTDMFSVDYDTGIIEISSNIPNNSKFMVDFSFDIPVRFNTDYLALEFNQLVDIPEIELLEIK